MVLLPSHRCTTNWQPTTASQMIVPARVFALRSISQIAIDGSLEGQVVPGRRISGLTFGLDLPVCWTSKCEPAQAQTVELTQAAAHSGIAGLHLAGATDAALFQWVEAAPGRIYDVTVFVRGRVSPGNSMSLGWLDASQRYVGDCTLARLPEGEWTGWVRLRQGGVAPAGACWVGIGVRVQHQVPGDWVDVDDFSVKEFPRNVETQVSGFSFFRPRCSAVPVQPISSGSATARTR